MSPRILLSGVFGPFGVDDEYGRKENIMELFHNQVTKAQGPASFRFFHRSFGLYFIAANIDADTTVLDFPSKRRFIRELKRGYDIVGLSFITPNFLKAQEMARLTRRYAPNATIILGGHGAAIEGVEDLIDCDHVVKGEGIRWMRAFLGQDPHAPFIHPALPSLEDKWIQGVPVPGLAASLLVPGVGCVNGCKFCSTTHFFGRRYTPFISTGEGLFEVARRVADARGTDDFFVMDENFLKDRARALGLIEAMERHQRFFSFSIFSSAETLTAFGVENLVRLGVMFVWIGVESADPTYEKNAGVDAAALVRELRAHGIAVLASGILCEPHHTPENIHVDIDHLVRLKSDFVQFMLLTPLPVTRLYEDYKQRGWLKEDLPFEEWHGQKMLNFEHPHFQGDAAERWLNHAFAQDYEVNGSSMLRIIETSFWGYQTLAAWPDRDACLDERMAQLKARTLEYTAMLDVIKRYPVNAAERQRAEALDASIQAALGAPGRLERLRRAGALLMATRWRLRIRLRGDGIQPKTICTRYRATGATGMRCHPCAPAQPTVNTWGPPTVAVGSDNVARDLRGSF